MPLLRTSLIAAAVSLFALSVSAQQAPDYYDTRQDMQDRMDRLEHDLQVMQRQGARGEPMNSSLNDVSSPAGSASALVRVAQMEETLRKLQGQIEEFQHQNDEMKAQLDRVTRDMDLRFKSIEDKQAAMSVAPAAVAAVPAAQPAAVPAGTGAEEEESSEPEATPATPAKPAKADAHNTARDQYNAALQLLRAHKHEEAGNAFEAFVKQYPKDPLTSNAYYWLGETYYVRADFTKAADRFRQGFESAPKGPKAADNLLKLGMSLTAMKRQKEACVVYKQIGIKYVGSSAAQKAATEITRGGCQ